jgi:hypothetical protein
MIIRFKILDTPILNKVLRPILKNPAISLVNRNPLVLELTEPNTKNIDSLLGILYYTNIWILRNTDFNRPKIYDSHISYREEQGEIWKDIIQIFSDGFDDCEGLASAVAAEYVVYENIPAYPFTLQMTKYLFHIQLVKIINGQKYIEDPSTRLGG